ncbi:MAG: MBOAT family protein, partial [Gammaproteobacteria bacterium]|nr:MBOAT family protein [Gammaproteobacteria bacterium]
HFLENFNYPYISRSIREFWQRWHISLSSWFRDYLYIPLGGNRKGLTRTYVNLLLVFFLTGLWHGASWTFVFWGLFHGSFLILERSPAGRLIEKLPVFLQHIYMLLVVMIAWVFFRSESLDEAWQYIAALVNFTAADYLDAPLFAVLNTEFYLALAVGLLFAMPVMPVIRKKFDQLLCSKQGAALFGLSTSKLVMQVLWMMALIIYSSAELISGAENPFLYFRF